MVLENKALGIYERFTRSLKNKSKFQTFANLTELAKTGILSKAITVHFRGNL